MALSQSFGRIIDCIPLRSIGVQYCIGASLSMLFLEEVVCLLYGELVAYRVAHSACPLEVCCLLSFPIIKSIATAR